MDVKPVQRFALPLVLVAIIALPEGNPGVSLCPFFNLTGLPCPGCGITRSLLFLVHLNFGQSLHFHPFGVAAFAWFLIWSSSQFLSSASKLFARPWVKGSFYGTLGLWLIFGIIRAALFFAEDDRILLYSHDFSQDKPILREMGLATMKALFARPH